MFWADLGGPGSSSARIERAAMDGSGPRCAHQWRSWSAHGTGPGFHRYHHLLVRRQTRYGATAGVYARLDSEISLFFELLS